MTYTVELVCISLPGKKGGVNRNNLYADGKRLESGNRGLRRAVTERKTARDVLVCSLLEGSGHEKEAGAAADLAGRELERGLQALRAYLLTPRERLRRSHETVNRALRENGGRAGIVTALLTPEEIYICNAGASRAYRLRGPELLQLSRDNDGTLGTTASELAETLYMAKGELKAGDIYILCSRNVPEKLNLLRFFELRQEDTDMKTAAEQLMAALPRGECAAMLLLRIAE